MAIGIDACGCPAFYGHRQSGGAREEGGPGIGSAANGLAIARISAAEIEGAVIAQVRGLLRQPEVVLGAWRAARASAPDMTKD